MAGKCNFTVDQGADWSVSITWTVDDVAVDLTGYTARMQVRRAHDSVAALVEITDVAGITLGGIAGTIGLAMTAAELEAVPAGTHVYDLEVINPAGIVARLLQGSFLVDPEVTRDDD